MGWWKNFNYILEIDILKSYFPKYLAVLRGDFRGILLYKDAQMPCWLRLWSLYKATIQHKISETILDMGDSLIMIMNSFSK